MTKRPLVVIESPFRGKTEEEAKAFLLYARSALKDSILRNEIPLASHLLYSQVLDDRIPEERELGMKLGWDMFRLCDFVAVYYDNGVSDGMQLGIDEAARLKRPVFYRSLKT